MGSTISLYTTQTYPEEVNRNSTTPTHFKVNWANCGLKVHNVPFNLESSISEEVQRMTTLPLRKNIKIKQMNKSNMRIQTIEIWATSLDTLQVMKMLLKLLR